MRFSIITPSFNQGEYLESSIKSVLSQGYHDLEYIIIDGGSTDDSVNIIKNYQHRLTWWVSEPDGGHGDALNKGFSKCTGDVIAWINSDDCYTPWAFDIVAEIFEQHPDVEWITGQHGIWDTQGRLISVQSVYKNIYDYILGRYEWIQQESVFFRRSLFERAGGKINNSCRYMIDGELWCRFFQLTDLWHVSTVLSGYRKHDANRAQNALGNVHEEMLSSINSMIVSVSPDIHHTVSQLRRAESIRRVLDQIPLPLDANKIARKVFANAYRKSIYRTLEYDTAACTWRKKLVPA